MGRYIKSRYCLVDKPYLDWCLILYLSNSTKNINKCCPTKSGVFPFVNLAREINRNTNQPFERNSPLDSLKTVFLRDISAQMASFMAVMYQASKLETGDLVQ